MPLFRKRSREPPSLIGMYLGGSGCLPVGYSRLIDHPDVAACINRIASLIASTPIRLLENTDEGDKRLQNALSRLVDIDPMPGYGSRSLLMGWIVTQLLGDGDGNAYVRPDITLWGEYSGLTPLVGAWYMPVLSDVPYDYYIGWQHTSYHPTEALHFRLYPDPDCPTRGRGLRFPALQLAKSLANTDALKQTLSSPDYKPPLIISVNADSPLSDEAERDKFRENYLEDSSGKPWVLPADLMSVQQIKPLSLADLAIKDNVELDKKSLCSLFGLPPFLLGLGAFNQQEYNLFVRMVLVPICEGIETELTHKLCPEHPTWHFKFNRRRLYAYDLNTIINIDCAMADRGYLNGDEVRMDADFDPVGLTDYTRLENYIPYDMAGMQSKLQKEAE